MANVMEGCDHPPEYILALDSYSCKECNILVPYNKYRKVLILGKKKGVLSSDYSAGDVGFAVYQLAKDQLLEIFDTDNDSFIDSEVHDNEVT